jgi:hypothetical protein
VQSISACRLALLRVSVTTSGVSAGAPSSSRTAASFSALRPPMAQRRLLPGGVALQQVFDDEAAGEACGAVDDEVKGFGHGMSLSRLFARQGRERRL